MNFDFKGMLDQAKNMKAQMETMKENLKAKRIDAESGAGMVQITMNGAHELIKINIAKEIINPDDTKMMEDLIIAAVNNANQKIADMNKEEMNKISGMMPNIPGLDLDL